IESRDTRIINPRVIWVHLRYRPLLGIVTPTTSILDGTWKIPCGDDSGSRRQQRKTRYKLKRLGQGDKSWPETRKYLEGIARNGVTVTRGHTLQAQLICAGEYKLGVELYCILQHRCNGRVPDQLVYPNPTTVASAQSWAIPVTAPHPYAAALLLDYILSAEGAELVADHGYRPAAAGNRSSRRSISRQVGRSRSRYLPRKTHIGSVSPPITYSKTSCFADDSRSFCFLCFFSAMKPLVLYFAAFFY